VQSSATFAKRHDCPSLPLFGLLRRASFCLSRARPAGSLLHPHLLNRITPGTSVIEASRTRLTRNELNLKRLNLEGRHLSHALAPVAIKSALISRNRPAVFYALTCEIARRSLHLGKAVRLSRGIFIGFRRSRRTIPARWDCGGFRVAFEDRAARIMRRLEVVQAACDCCREDHGPLGSIRVCSIRAQSFCALQSAGCARRGGQRRITM